MSQDTKIELNKISGQIEKLTGFIYKEMPTRQEITRQLDDMRVLIVDDFHNTIDPLAKGFKDLDQERLMMKNRLNEHEADIRQIKTRLKTA
jgi:hypoxanthine phosphoribosyltransferase